MEISIVAEGLVVRAGWRPDAGLVTEGVGADLIYRNQRWVSNFSSRIRTPHRWSHFCSMDIAIRVEGSRVDISGPIRTS